MKKRCFLFEDGRSLHWYEAGDGRPLVLLHGWAMSAAAFHEFADLLGQDFHLLIPDLPGHGESSPPLRNDLEGLAADLTVWLAAVAPGPVALLGWSLGGMLAMQLAADGHLPTERLILVGTTPRFTNADGWSFGLPPAQVHALARNLKRRFEATLGDFFALTFADEDIPRERLRAIRNFAVRNSALPDAIVALDLLHFLAVQDQRAVLARLQIPVLVLHGALDRISPVAAGQWLAEQCPMGTFMALPGIGHAPFLSRPQQIADRVRGFL